MEAAARLAQRAWPDCRPNPGVAALLVKDGRIIARGWTKAGGRPHAEAALFEELECSRAMGGAARSGIEGAARGAVLYVTLEPCAHESERGPCCTDAIIAAQPERVVIGQVDPDPRTSGKGIERIEKSGIAVSVLENAAARASLAPFLTRMTHHRPHVLLKLAVSLDGCIALADGTSQWITGDAARAHVHTQRARHDAILIGGGTWRTDKPRLDVRLPGLEQRSPTRILLSRGVAPDGVRVINNPEDIAKLDVQSIYVEGGAHAAASLLAADLVDTLHIYRAPIIIGDGRRAIGDIGLADLTAAHGRWQLVEQRKFGSDEFTRYERLR